MRNYTLWHSLKEKIELKNIEEIRFREQEIWWCSLGENIGCEEDGKNELFERPVLILRKFNHEMFWGIPLTSQIKEHQYYHIFELHGVQRSPILSQIRTFSSKRLLRRISKLSDTKFIEIQKGVQKVGFQKNGPPCGSPRVPDGNL